MDKPFWGHDLWAFLSFHIAKVTTYEAEMSRNYLTKHRFLLTAISHPATLTSENQIMVIIAHIEFNKRKMKF